MSQADPQRDYHRSKERMAGSKDAATVGIGFGTALAIAISWSANKSIIWAIIHGLLSWIYVIYYAIRYQ
jgi:hypothetical protein